MQSNQRDRILAATIEAAAELGYSEMHVQDIVKRAGVSRRTFYELYRNKHAAFMEAFDVEANRLFAAVQEAWPPDASFEERITAGFQAFLLHLASVPGASRVCIVEALAAGAEAVARRSQVMRAFAAVIDDGARELPAHPLLPAMTADTIVGGAYDAIFRYIGEGRTDDLPTLLPDLVEVALLPYIGAEAASAHGRRLRAAGAAAAAAVAERVTGADGTSSAPL